MVHLNNLTLIGNKRYYSLSTIPCFSILPKINPEIKHVIMFQWNPHLKNSFTNNISFAVLYTTGNCCIHNPMFFSPPQTLSGNHTCHNGSVQSPDNKFINQALFLCCSLYVQTSISIWIQEIGISAGTRAPHIAPTLALWTYPCEREGHEYSHKGYV